MRSFARTLTSLVLMLCVLAVAATASAAGFVKWSPANQGLETGSGAGVMALTSGGPKPIAYAIVDGVGLFRSTDWGETWTRLRGEVPPLKAPYAVAASPADGNVVWAAGKELGTGLWQSTDGGATWKKIGGQDAGLASDDVQAITLQAETANLILVGHRSGNSISVSTDGGKSGPRARSEWDVEQQLPVIVSRDKWVVLSLAKEVVRTTADGGQTWAAATGNANYFPGPLPVIQTEGYLFASSHHGTNKSTDGGQTWMARGTSPAAWPRRSCWACSLVRDSTMAATGSSRR